MTYRKLTSKLTGFNASALQVRKAYEAHFSRPLPETLAFSAAAQEMVTALGQEAARDLVLAQTND